MAHFLSLARVVSPGAQRPASPNNTCASPSQRGGPPEFAVAWRVKSLKGHVATAVAKSVFFFKFLDLSVRDDAALPPVQGLRRERLRLLDAIGLPFCCEGRRIC